ncbi:MAG: hypothetical protein AAGD96_10995 [Chloroflexota bacterium]
MINVGYEQKTTSHAGGGIEIETKRGLTNEVASGGDWEPEGDYFNQEIGRRYVYDNMGYALVKSGVANIYSMKMRKTGNLIGITMLPDPEIKEDYNIIMFPISPNYTKQGTLDGMIGFKKDEDWKTSPAGRGSYFKPHEVNNLEKQIDAYEAKLLANYANFNARGLGKKIVGPFKKASLENSLGVIENGIEIPYDFGKQISKRNLVNTYVWSSAGGFFTEQQETGIVREESLGGSYSGRFGLGISGDLKVLVGGVGGAFSANYLLGNSVETKIVKTKKEGHNFGLDVALNVEGFLRKYTGNSRQLYSKDDVPGKVTGYRFKTFYLTPDKKHFQTFWNKVVDQNWLQTSQDADAIALRQARGNINHVWRVMHRVTYVSRVPSKDKVNQTDEKPTRSVIHQIPNRGLINLVLDVMENKHTADGKDLAGANQKEHIGSAVIDVLDHQLQAAIPWWQNYLDAAAHKPGSLLAKELKRIKQAVYEYMLAYYETGEANEDKYKRKLLTPTTHKGNGDDKDKGPQDTLGETAKEDGATHLYTFSEDALSTDLIGTSGIITRGGLTIESTSDIPGCEGRLIFPGDRPKGHGRIPMGFDWGRDADRTWEMVFKIKSWGEGMLLSHEDDLPESQRIVQGLGLDWLEADELSIQAVDGEIEGISQLTKADLEGKAIYLSLSNQSEAEELKLTIRIEGNGTEFTGTYKTTAGNAAGGWLLLGADRSENTELEIHHMAVYSKILSPAALNRRLSVLKFF